MAVRYETEQPVLTPAVSQMSMLPTIDREGITKFINEQGYLTYIVRTVKINSYLKSLMQRIKVEQIQKFPQKDNTRRFRWKPCLETMYMQVKKLREPVEAINL